VAAALVCAGSTATAAIVYRTGVIDDGGATLPATGESAVPASISGARTTFLGGLVPVPHQEHFFKSDLAGSTDLSSILGGMGSLTGGALDNTPFDGVGNFNGRWDTTDDATTTNKTWVEFDGDVTITLGALFNAFAFNLTDAGDITDPASINIELYDASDVLVGTSVVGPGDTSGVVAASGFSRVLFFGVHSDMAFNKIVLRTTQTAADPDDNGLDDLILGNVRRDTGRVPEPGTLGIVGLALLLGSRIKRRR
jgi:PEP-CTERM motif